MIQLGLLGLGAMEMLIILIVLIFGLGMIMVYIFYLITLSKTLSLCHPQTRSMNPGEVWMVLIPFFGIVWHFIVVGRVADSLSVEFRNRGIQIAEERPGYKLGLWALILPLCGIIPVLGILTGLAGIVLLVMYWNRISDYKKQLEQHNIRFGQGNPFAFPNQFSNTPM